ncbi:self-incompatibility protein S1-like [Andrographis paniculata]|uniref:self-incompatibility protein S1-like n=1 Tax=Andrographis paniculata TaxID=175694 RepID=UPI0021E84D46|nr:self-incompatibility protein S1-like [Andrographis paniculata]
MDCHVKVVAILILLAANGFMAISSTCVFTRGYRVHILNKLSSSSYIKVHCRAIGDDRGEHTLSQDDDYNFHFCNSFFEDTKFICELRWSNLFASIEAFKSSFEIDRLCGPDCYWVATEYGIAFGKDPTNVKQKYDWLSDS